MSQFLKSAFRRISALLLMLLGIFSCACAPKESSDNLPVIPDESMRLTIYTSHKEEVYGPIIREFELRTGIWVNVVTGGTAELLERISKEGPSPVCDVMFGGSAENLRSFGDLFSPYLAAGNQALNPAFTTEDGLYTPFSSLPLVLIYNTRLISADAITGWSDLLNPAWKGQIAFADPDVSGSSYTMLYTLISASGRNEETALISFCENLDGVLLSGSGAVVDAVADGSYPIGITLEETAIKRIAAGESIAMVYPVEGTSNVPDGSALIKNAPHAENAKLFLDFVLSKDVQQQLGQTLSRRCVRADIPAAESLPSLKNVHFIQYDMACSIIERDTLLDKFYAIMGRIRS